MSHSVQAKNLDDLPESNIKPREKFSIVWLIPFIALAIDGWLAYKAWSEMGPEITITFDTADGLEAGKTKIKYKNVEIGTIKTINVKHSDNSIEVIAEMDKDISEYLTDKTRFWVVRARVDASGVSGLSTLLSGAYINVDPSKKGKKTRKYTGLKIPPVITGDISGKRFILKTKNLGSVERDVPVYYRKYMVGKVEEVKLDDEGQFAYVHVFIKAPYDQWVNSSTKFWNSSGIDFTMGASGFTMNTESIISILIGGITFDSKNMSNDVKAVENNAKFKLFDSYDDSLATDYSQGKKFIVKFSESLRGLSVGAPVEFRGIQMGEVIDIQMLFDIPNKELTIPVVISLDNSKIKFTGNSKLNQQLVTRKERMNFLIKKGIRAQLNTGSLLTGKLYVELDVFPKAEPFKVDWSADIPELPTVHGTLGAIKTNLSSILHKADSTMTQINELSYKLNHNIEPQVEETLTQINSMMVQVGELSKKLNHKVAPELSSTLKSTEKTLLSMRKLLRNDSPLQQDLHITLEEFTKMATSIKRLTDYLERHPESLLKGK